MDELADQLTAATAGLANNEKTAQAQWGRCESYLNSILAYMEEASTKSRATGAPKSTVISSEGVILEVGKGSAEDTSLAAILSQMKQQRESLEATQTEIKALRSTVEAAEQARDGEPVDLKRVTVDFKRGSTTVSDLGVKGGRERIRTDDSHVKSSVSMAPRDRKLTTNSDSDSDASYDMVRARASKVKEASLGTILPQEPQAQQVQPPPFSLSANDYESDDHVAMWDIMMGNKESPKKISAKKKVTKRSSTCWVIDIIVSLGRSEGWNWWCIIMAVLNAVLCGIQADAEVGWAFRRASDPTQSFEGMDSEQRIYVMCNFVFLVWLFLELLVSFIAHGCCCCAGKVTAAWIMFDLVVLVVLIFDWITWDLKLSYVKVFRAMRLGRVVQAFRFAILFKSLNMMLISLVSSVISLMWAFFLFFLFTYVAGILMIQGITAYFDESMAEARSLGTISPGLPSDNLETLNSLYGSIGKAITTLFRSVTGGDWGELAEPLAPIGWAYTALWIVYIAFMVFGLLNIFVGIFVENVRKAAEQNSYIAQVEQSSKEDKLRSVIKRVFTDLDTDHSGWLSQGEFNKIIHDEKVVAQLAGLGIEARRLQPLFKVLDRHRRGMLSLEEVIEGCFDIQGDVKALDVLRLHQDNERLERGMCALLKAGQEAGDWNKRLEKRVLNLSEVIKHRNGSDED